MVLFLASLRPRTPPNQPRETKPPSLAFQPLLLVEAWGDFSSRRHSASVTTLPPNRATQRFPILLPRTPNPGHEESSMEPRNTGSNTGSNDGSLVTRMSRGRTIRYPWKIKRNKFHANSEAKFSSFKEPEIFLPRSSSWTSGFRSSTSVSMTARRG
jgi:hypothetical protein